MRVASGLDQTRLRARVVGLVNPAAGQGLTLHRRTTPISDACLTGIRPDGVH